MAISEENGYRWIR